jgi:hypothetical protein
MVIMETALVVFGILTCVAVLAGFLWVLNFLFAPEDHIDSDWYTEDEGL